MTAVTPIPFAPEGPQPLLRPIPPGQPYPVHALGPLRPAVEAVQGLTLAPVAIPAGSALAVASLGVQAFADVETLAGPRPVSLYVLTIAKSGERKSSCDAPLMAALREHESEAALAQREETRHWQNAHALWKGERDRILADAKKGQGERRTGAQADLEALGPEPAAPPSPDRTVTTPTYQGLVRQFREGLPSLRIFSDEGGQFLGDFSMKSENRQATLAALNDLWQGAPIKRTLGGEGSYTLLGRRLAAHLMVQPIVARGLLGDPLASGTGFLARFLIAEPASAIGTRLHARTRPDEAGALDAFGAKLGATLSTPLPMEAETRALKTRLLPLSREARALLIGFSDAIEVAQAPRGDVAHLMGTASKAAEQAARIAGVLTLWGDLDAREVAPETMADAIALAQFYLSEAARLAEAAAVSAETERAERLRRWLLEDWPEAEVLPSDVLQRAPIRALRESKTARAAMKMLEAHGWLVPLEGGTVVRGKARREAWRVVRGAGDVV